MIRTTTFTLALSLFVATAWSLGLTNSVSAQQSVKVFHKTVKVGDLDIFYREAGPKDAPTILLLHGFPTSSQMFRNLIPVSSIAWIWFNRCTCVTWIAIWTQAASVLGSD